MPTAQQLTEILNAALQKLWEEDKDLFIDENGRNRKIHERTVVARFFHYLIDETNTITPEPLTWDYEYNRQNGTEVKAVFNNDDNVKHIVPDLILHKRNTNKNHCVIEVKCKPSSSLKGPRVKKDFDTLRNMLMQLNYNFAIELIISKNSATLVWLTKNNQLSAITTTIEYHTPLNLITVLSTTQSISIESPYVYFVERLLPKCIKDTLNNLCREQKIHLLSTTANHHV